MLLARQRGDPHPRRLLDVAAGEGRRWVIPVYRTNRAATAHGMAAAIGLGIGRIKHLFGGRGPLLAEADPRSLSDLT